MNKKYTDEHIEFLRNNIVGTSFKDLTNMFNMQFDMNLSKSAIVSLTNRHALHNKIDAKFNTGWEPTQFKKGHNTWNKGKKGLTKANKTSFKKGDKPHNWVPLGTEREKGGYIHVKIQEGKFQHNWRSKHVLIWEAHNGPIPRGHVVIFGDGNKQNFDINNLILVSRNQLKCLNQQKLIQKDADLTRAAITIVDLQNKIIDKGKKGEREKQ